MYAHFISLVASFVIVAILFFVIGNECDRLKEKRVVKNFVRTVVLALALLGVSVSFLANSYKYIRAESINSYREGAIVEQVNYRVTEQEGAITHRDSTINYVRVKD